MKRSIILTLCLTLALVVVTPAFAGDDEELAGYLGSFNRDMERVTEKLFDLADAFPADKYGWSPTEGVRTVSEMYIHIAGANFFIANALGVPMPEGISPEMEKNITSKDDVIKTLKQSFEHVHKAVAAAKDQNLDETIPLFGRDRPRRDAFIIISTHAHEHLGQGIAYARMAGVTPPWSQ